VGLVSLLPAAALVPVPLLIKRLFDSAIPDGDKGELVWIAIGLLVLQVGSAVATNAGLYLVLRHAKHGILHLRDELAEKLYSVSVGYLSRREQDSLYDYLLQESQRVEWMSSALFGRAIPAAVLVVGISAVLLGLNPVLFVLTFTFVPLMVLSNRVVGARLRAAGASHSRSIEAFGRNTRRLLRLMPLTRSRDAEPFELRRQHDHHEVVRQRAMTLEWLRNTYQLLQRCLVAASLALTLLVGGLAVVGGSITLGELFAFYAGVALLRQPVDYAVNAMPEIIGGSVALARVVDFLEEPDRTPYDGTETIDFAGTIEVRAISFAYTTQNVLEQVSLSLEPGRITALVGPNGAGKSTLVNLLLGFYRPQEGLLLADGHPFDELDLRSVRRHIGVVLQEPLLVDGTIAENLAYPDLDLSDAELVAAARLATADDFVTRLPQGYDTRVGDGGLTLSGGQRQRLAIARALVREPRLLILDEPTNSLDERSLREVLENLTALPSAPAVLLISHDQRALAGADVVVHLHEGRVVAVEGPSFSRPAERAARRP
jgi:ABC-type multidrug transport system fused ATPase/permease subunit